MQLGLGTILRSDHKMGLQRVQSAPLDANVHQKGPNMFPAPPFPNLTEPATPQHQEDIRRKRTMFKNNQQKTITRQSREKVHPKSKRSILIFGTSN